MIIYHFRGGFYMYYHFTDINRSITALTSSILSHYGVSPVNPTLPDADRILRSAPRNIVLILLDGLGYPILTRHLPEDSFLRRRLSTTLSSVFPPTTAAAATALESGLYPSQSGWLGWSIYWPPLNKNIALYPNTDDTGAPAAPFHVGRTMLKTPSFLKQVQESAHIPSFSVSAKGDFPAATLDELTAHIKAVTNRPGPHLIYAYLNEPDHTLHKEGCRSENVHLFLQKADYDFQQLAADCPDTLFLLTADHGFTDVDGICLEDAPALMKTLVRPPSIEPRALNFVLRPGTEEAFLQSFTRFTENTYTLYTKKEALSRNLFGPGPAHPQLTGMLGDYLAVATTPLTLFPNRSYMNSMIATHGGMTPEELTVPFICWRSDIVS